MTEEQAVLERIAVALERICARLESLITKINEGTKDEELALNVWMNSDED